MQAKDKELIEALRKEIAELRKEISALRAVGAREVHHYHHPTPVWRQRPVMNDIARFLCA